MITWFLSLPIEQRGWALFGVGLIVLGITVALSGVIDSWVQRRGDRAAQPDETVLLPRVDAVALRRHLARDLTDTEGGGSR